MLPGVHKDIRDKMRPDLLLIEHLSTNDAKYFDLWPSEKRDRLRSTCTMHTFEIGYGSNFNHEEKIEEKNTQHDKLHEELRKAGWKNIRKHIIALGTGAYVFKDTEELLKSLEVPPHVVQKLMQNLHKLAVEKISDIETSRRILEKGT